MALYNGSEKVSSQISTTQYADVTDLMKYMTIEVGDIGQVMLPLNENENKRRYLNGQIILQEQFKKFTEKLKKAVSLYPTLACTESQWQALRKADPDDQCAKFVIDNVNGTIRLPRVKYLVGNLNLYRFAEGMPNRRLVKVYKSGNNWYHWYSDGWIEQGGYFGATGSDVNTIVKLHKTMKDNKYDLHINMQWNGTGAASWQYLCGHNMTTTQFECTCQSSTYHNWVVRGYTSSIPDSTQQYSNSIESQFESPYYIQVNTGVDYEVDVTNKITNNNPYAFGMTQRSNAKLNNVSWLESNGNFHSGSTYSEYYEWLLKNYNTPTDDIVVKLNTDSGITEYDYVINTADRTFKLPTLLGDETLDNHAKAVNPGFPRPRSDTTYTYTTPYNGTLYVCINRGNTTGYTPSLHVNGVQYFAEPYWIANCTSWTVHLKRGDKVLIKCADSGLTTDTFSFVQQRFIKAESGYKHLYFYVGEAEQNLDLINVGNMAENFATVSSKLDEISTASEYMSTVETQVNEMSTVVNTFDTKMASVDEHVAELTTTVEGMADVKAQMGEIATQMEEVTVKMEEVNTVADNINQFTQRYVVETFVEGPNFYTLYNDGWCEQGGLNTTNGSGVLASVTFLKEFKNTDYFVNRTNINGNTNNPYANFISGIQNKSTTGFTFLVDTLDSYCNGSMWYACGYTIIPTEQEPTDTPTEE
jgi:hypothetical protein